MQRTAAKLGVGRARRKPGSRRPVLPSLWLVTDPQRLRDPIAAAARLPRGAGVIFRGFGRSDALAVGLALAAVAQRRKLVLLVGADPALAARIGAQGVHLPERALGLGRRLRARRPNWIITGAAHSARALRRASRSGLDAALLSPVFASRSPSAKQPLGPARFALLVRGAQLPVFALGGLSATTARRLARTGAAGLAAVEALSGA